MKDFTNLFSFDDAAQESATIRVIGVGGGGGNAVNKMLDKCIQGIEFIAVNTDSQALQENLSPIKIQIGRELTKGLGAGARPSVGADAAMENHREIEAALEGSDMVFITAGMGGGTGTGAAPVVAEIAKKMNILTVAVVTKPFDCEGRKRFLTAEQGIEHLRGSVDTLIIIPNERLLDIAEEDTTVTDAFIMADDVLYDATRGISDLITVHGLINLDFADVRTTMVNGGTALMGSATAKGDKRSEKAAQEAISSPLLGGVSIKGARNVLVNITAGPNLGIREATQATSVIQQEAGEDAEVIFGTVIDPEQGDEIRVTVIATGFDRAADTKSSGDGFRQHATLENIPSRSDYKGEDSLKNLDTPAFERRTPIAATPGSASLATAPLEKVREIEETRAVGEADAAEPRVANVVHIRSEVMPNVGERIRKDDTEVPAFLRKMMD